MSGRSLLPRVAALVGPYASGKTTLLESLLLASGSIQRKGSVSEGTSVGDASPEARQRLMSTEVNIATANYLDDRWTFLDCPGSIEFQQDTYNALAIADAAIVVVEPEPTRAVMVAPLLKFLDENAIPHVIFINKVESSQARLRETLDSLQTLSDLPLLMREVPLKNGDAITGYVDLVSERAFEYRDGRPSELVQLPETALSEEKSARQDMLEHLADFDDHLLEELLSDLTPPTTEVYENVSRTLASDLIVPVFFGSANSDHGIRRLLKCLRHDVPSPAETSARRGWKPQGGAVARVFKTVHATHTGKLSYARVWRGEFTEGALVNGTRPAGLYSPQGATLTKLTKAGVGEIVALARLEAVKTGEVLGLPDPDVHSWPTPLPRLFPSAVRAEKKQDEVKLTAALAKLVEEDPSLSIDQSQATGELVLWGQGEIHLQVALDKLKNRFNLAVTGHRPQVPYKETIRKGVSEHGRHKRQSGGHGQFGDIYIDIAPQPRGAGFQFAETVVGGVVPRQYIPSVAEGVEDYLKRGPLGFPVVDVKVTLTSGSYHSVDSSDMAFKTAARIAMTEGMPKCEPVVLEPILAVEIAVPADYTSKAQRIISGRRGQILGYEAKDGWKGWDVVSAFLPQAEMADLIVELRSLTMGVGTFAWKFDHLQEMAGRGADKVVEERKTALAAQ
ncbi:elongation factor G [Telmatospirillum siberiense]|uniref:Elongation factor G n=1 Tax=Telmatospirillum siberiense TaxID=382514 RepID=A0A2N3PUD5_9PROT|nr:elongation factor G [Telmatospirillum siberiense]PKU24007.1 elongation factor G [Telmatospirillum siberiense]